MFLYKILVLTYFPFFRFVALTCILGAPYGYINPRTPFTISPELVSPLAHPGLAFVPPFRREIMSVFANLLLLDEEALFRHYFESRPLSEFKSRAKFDQASKLYPPGFSPYDDLLNTVQNCGLKWIMIVRGLM